MRPLKHQPIAYAFNAAVDRFDNTVRHRGRRSRPMTDAAVTLCSTVLMAWPRPVPKSGFALCLFRGSLADARAAAGDPHNVPMRRAITEARIVLATIGLDLVTVHGIGWTVRQMPAPNSGEAMRAKARARLAAEAGARAVAQAEAAA